MTDELWCMIRNDQVPILLAYSMNSEPLSIEHGGPLRVVVPGIIGARWTKWVARIVIRAEESESYYQRQDYRLLPPIADASTKGYWLARTESMQEYRINCVICSPAPDEILSRDSSIVIRGYSIAPHGKLELCRLRRIQYLTYCTIQVYKFGECWHQFRSPTIEKNRPQQPELVHYPPINGLRLNWSKLQSYGMS
jgi:hypothetical protein